MAIWRKWLWDRSGFMLAILVLASLVLGWSLPATYDFVVTLAYAQIIMAIVVVIKEVRALTATPKK